MKTQDDHTSSSLDDRRTPARGLRPRGMAVGIDLLGTGGVMAVRVPTTVHPQRFYRLLIVP